MYSGNGLFTVLYEVCDQNLGFSLLFLSLKEKKFGYCLDAFRASLCPSSGEKTTCYCIWVLAGSVGCGWLRCCGAML